MTAIAILTIIKLVLGIIALLMIIRKNLRKS
jgi:hypothetical protein